MRRIWIPSLVLIGVLVGGLLSRLATDGTLVRDHRSSPFGYLEVSDSSLVHIRRGTSELIADYDHEPSDLLSWQLHLPQGKQWNLCWAFGRFPRDGMPTAAAGKHVLAPTKPSEHPELLIRFFGSVESGWSARFGYGDVPAGTYKTWLVPVPDELGPTIWHASQSFVNAAGEESKIDGWVTQTYTGEKPIVILRLGKANMNGFGRHDPYNGILVWIEQGADIRKSASPDDETLREESSPSSGPHH